jgi:hypothetical protein
MADFIKAVEAADRKIFPNTLESDVRVLALLHNLENLSGT